MANSAAGVVASACAVVVRPRCPECGVVGVINMPLEAYRAWKGGAGAFIQDAWPEASASVREQLISGMCGGCWESIFSSDDGEDR